MALSQKARWAKIRGESKTSAPAKPEPLKTKRRISKEGMARIIAATKKRWRLQRAAAKAQSGAKKAAPVGKKAAAKKSATKKAAAGAAQMATATAGQ